MEDVKSMVKTYPDSGNRITAFKDSNTSKEWLIGFKRRWDDRMRNPEVLTKARKENLSTESLISFFDVYSQVLEDRDFFDDDAANRIFNADETSCSTVPSRRKMFFKKSTKDTYLLAPTCGKVVLCGSANGDYLDPRAVYKSKNLYDQQPRNLQIC